MGMMGRREILRAGVVVAALGRPWRAHGGAAFRVVIAGGGFAGSGCALALRRLAPQIQITVVDPQVRYTTCPMSNTVIAGLRTLDSIVLSRHGLERSGIRYVQAAVTDIDATKRQVRLTNGVALSYERLVVAPGIRFLYGTPAGYDEAAAVRMPHAWDGGPSTATLAHLLREVPNGGTVAISVPSGLMRCPPGPYERASLIAYWLSTHRARCKVLIFDSNNHFPRQDLFRAAWTELYPGMIQWIAPTEGGQIERVDARANVLYSSSGAHPVSLASVIPPQAPGAVAQLAGLSSGHGWCPVNPMTFESPSAKYVHVIGDACIAGAMPKAASAARSQALQCATAINAAWQNRPVSTSELDSVCYSFLSPQAALAMHARFAVSGDQIEALRDASAGAAKQTSSNAREARAWYRNIRASCFGAGEAGDAAETLSRISLP